MSDQETIEILRGHISELQEFLRKLSTNIPGHHHDSQNDTTAPNEELGYPMLVTANRRNNNPSSYFNSVLMNLMEGLPEVVNTYYMII